jgi:spoIIIJ-associated protein
MASAPEEYRSIEHKMAMPAEPKATLEQLLNLLGFPATVEEHHMDDGVLLDVKTEDSGRLIGRQGQTLSDLQYITNRLLFQQDPSSPKIMVDVSGYRAQAREALVKKAKEAAEKVRRWGDVVELEPLSAFDRRIIHQALKDDPTIETHSVEVEGTEKKAILLRPKH